MYRSEEQRRVIILPVETAARELDAKLLLSVFAAAKGMTVILGRRPELNMRLHEFPRGIYVAHNFDRRRRRILSIARKLGYRIVAWDEEGLVWRSPEAYCRRRVAAKTIRTLDAIVAWGKEQEEALHACGTKNVPVVALGNPRADLFRPELIGVHKKQVQEIQSRYGEFVLVNSIFGWLNHYRHYDPDASENDTYLTRIARISGHTRDYLKSHKHAFLATQKAVRFLAQDFPRLNFVIRPHPSEAVAAWRDMEKLGNVHVVKDSRLIPWLVASRVMIHAGCTTAVEYALLGRCSVLYTGGAELHVAPQPRVVSRLADDFSALATFVRNPPNLDTAAKAALSCMVASFGADRTASEYIVDFLAGLEPSRSRGSLSGHILLHVRNLQHALFGRVSPYQKQKFEDMPLEGMRDRVRAIADALKLPLPSIRAISSEGNLVRIDSA